MKKLMNAADTMLSESLSGFVAAHRGIVTLGPESKFVQRAQLTPGKVALISGGGADDRQLRCGFLFDRQQRPRAVCYRLRSGQWRALGAR